jgi:hypothetical protein
MDVDAHVALPGEERRPCVKTDAHADRAGRECLGELRGCGEGSGRRRKRDKERITLGVDLHSIVTATRFADDLPVCGERLGVGLRSQVVQKLRRPLDVGEEKGDGAGRKLLKHAHDHGRAETFRPGRRPSAAGSRRASQARSTAPDA